MVFVLAVLKGQCHEIFDFWFFSWISFPQASEYTITAISNFLKIRGDIRGSRYTIEKIFKQKNFNNFVWAPLGSRVNINIHFCLQVHFRRQICRRYRWHRWQICHRCQQHKGNWWQICRRCRWYRRQFATGVIDTGGKFATGVGVANNSANFRKNSKWPYCYYQGLGGRWFMKKTWSKKSRDTVPLRILRIIKRLF